MQHSEPGVWLKRVVFVNERSKRSSGGRWELLGPRTPLWLKAVWWSLLPSKGPCGSPTKSSWERCWLGTAFSCISAGYIGFLICCLCCSLTLSPRTRDVNYSKRQHIEELTWSKPVYTEDLNWFFERWQLQVYVISLESIFPVMLSSFISSFYFRCSCFIFFLLVIFFLLSPYSTFLNCLYEEAWLLTISLFWSLEGCFAASVAKDSSVLWGSSRAILCDYLFGVEQDVGWEDFSFICSNFPIALQKWS